MMPCVQDGCKSMQGFTGSSLLKLDAELQASAQPATVQTLSVVAYIASMRAYGGQENCVRESVRAILSVQSKMTIVTNGISVG